MVDVGDTVKVYHSVNIGEVVATDVDRDMERPDDCTNMFRAPNGDTLVRERWSRQPRCDLADGPGHYIIVAEHLLQSV